MGQTENAMATTTEMPSLLMSERTVPPELRRGLRNYWYPILLSSDLPFDRPVGITRLGEELVAWRDGDGVPHVFVDRCPHRGARLSIGDLAGGQLQCRYHGLQFDGTGQCRFYPAERVGDGRQAARFCAPGYPVEERDGVIWAYLGDVDVFPPPPWPAHDDHPELADPNYVWITRSMVWNANWLLIQDNTSDLFHLSFLHGHFEAVPDEAEGLRLETIPPGNPLITPQMAIGTAVDQTIALDRERGILITRADAEDDPSVVFHNIEFTLPCSVAVWVPVPMGGPPVRSIQYEYALDEEHTVVFVFIGRDASADGWKESRQICDFFWQTASQVFGEDSWMTDSQGDVEACYQEEQLLPTDAGTVRVRKAIQDAHREQQRRIAELGEIGSSPSVRPRFATKLKSAAVLYASPVQPTPFAQLDPGTGCVSTGSG